MTSLLRPALDLSIYHSQRICHGIRVTLTWLFEGSNKHGPCMVLTPAHSLPLPGVVRPVVIPMREAWRYAMTKENGGDTIGDPEWVCLAVNDWLGNGYLPGNPHNPRDHFAVVDAINDNLRDLFSMPPRRPTRREVIADATITNRSTGKSVTQEVENHV